VTSPTGIITVAPENRRAQHKRVEELVTQISARLRPVCADMPQAEFDAMVRTIAERTYRWEAHVPTDFLRVDGT
jgi:hypothetical protein